MLVPSHQNAGQKNNITQYIIPNCGKVQIFHNNKITNRSHAYI
jgi:predicted RNA-binding Zn-ribbon protein involved in translation (DUF1610 family)